MLLAWAKPSAWKAAAVKFGKTTVLCGICIKGWKKYGTEE